VSIHVNSRYVGATTLLIDSDRGKQHTLYPNQFAAVNARYTVYIAKDTDTFEGLAQRVYGDPTYWWRIADLNPHVFFPTDIRPGVQLRVPLA
jgi:nucleoid-associated protein YgaU